MMTSSSRGPCAACRLLRRKCTRECVFAPHFPPEQPERFATVHNVFGASNVAKLLGELDRSQRSDAVNSLIYEADSRLKDPVYGCIGPISILQKKLKQVRNELATARQELESYLGPEAMEAPSMTPFSSIMQHQNGMPSMRIPTGQPIGAVQNQEQQKFEDHLQLRLENPAPLITSSSWSIHDQNGIPMVDIPTWLSDGNVQNLEQQIFHLDPGNLLSSSIIHDQNGMSMVDIPTEQPHGALQSQQQQIFEDQLHLGGGNLGNPLLMTLSSSVIQHQNMMPIMDIPSGQQHGAVQNQQEQIFHLGLGNSSSLQHQNVQDKQKQLSDTELHLGLRNPPSSSVIQHQNMMPMADIPTNQLGGAVQNQREQIFYAQPYLGLGNPPLMTSSSSTMQHQNAIPLMDIASGQPHEALQNQQEQIFEDRLPLGLKNPSSSSVIQQNKVIPIIDIPTDQPHAAVQNQQQYILEDQQMAAEQQCQQELLGAYGDVHNKNQQNEQVEIDIFDIGFDSDPDLFAAFGSLYDESYNQIHNYTHETQHNQKQNASDVVRHNLNKNQNHQRCQQVEIDIFNSGFDSNSGFIAATGDNQIRSDQHCQTHQQIHHNPRQSQLLQQSTKTPTQNFRRQVNETQQNQQTYFSFY